MDASDEFAVVTGASSGIGAAVARRLAAEGRALALVGRDVDRLAAEASVCRATGSPLVVTARVDQCDRAATAAALARFAAERPIGLFVASAGILDGRRDGETIERPETAARVIDTDLSATVDAVHAILPAMLARRRGSVVLISSLAGFAPLADAPAYSAAKAGLVAWGLAMREALAGTGVRITVACPSYVTSAMTARHIGPHPGEIDADVAARRILAGATRDRAIVAFPQTTGWLARLALLAPEPIRRRVMASLRFHVAGD